MYQPERNPHLEKTLRAESWLIEAGLKQGVDLTSMKEERIRRERMPYDDKAFRLTDIERHDLMVIAGMNPEIRENRRLR